MPRETPETFNVLDEPLPLKMWPASEACGPNPIMSWAVTAIDPYNAELQIENEYASKYYITLPPDIVAEIATKAIAF